MKVARNPAPIPNVCQCLCRINSYDTSALTLPMKLSLWDFAGQEFFYNTHHAFMARHALYLIIFDIPRYVNETCRVLEFQRIQFWLHSIRIHTDSPAVLVATHIDLIDDNTLDEIKQFFTIKLDFFIVTHRCKIFFNRRCPFFFVDNTSVHADDTEDLKAALKQISQRIDSVYNSYPIKWRIFLQFVQQSRDSVSSGNQPMSKLVVSLEYLEGIYTAYTSDELKNMLEFFNSIGEIVFDALQQYVILDPQYLVDIMQNLTIGKEASGRFPETLPYHRHLQTNGILHRYLAKKILDIDNDQNVDILLRLLESKDLICNVSHLSDDHSSDDAVFLVPSLLPICSNHLPSNWDKKFFDFGDDLPSAVFYLRVQNEQFSEEKGFILREKEVDFPPGFEPPIHGLQSELSTTELSDSLMNGHKSSVYQVPNSLFTNQSSLRNCHKMTNCEQFRTKCCVKIAATLTLASTDVFLIKM